MKIGIIGAIGVDDIGDVIMLEAALAQITAIGNRNGINTDFVVFALNREIALEQLDYKGFCVEIVESLQPSDLSNTINNDYDFEQLLKIDFIKETNNIEPYYREIEKCDVLFFIGGGYFNEYWGVKLIPTFVIPIILGYQMRKPIFISGVNIGPFSQEQVNKLKGLFSNVHYLFLRDRDKSAKVLEKLGGTSGKVVFGADDVLPFWYRQDDAVKTNPLCWDDTKKYGILNLHHWAEIYSSSYIQFYKSLALFFDYILDNKYVDRIYFMPFDYFKGLDYECGRRLKTFLNDREEYVVLEPTKDHIGMRNMVRASEFLIGSRYHPIVFGLGEHVPVLGIYTNELYEHKILGAFQVLNRDGKQEMIHVNDVSLERLKEWYCKAILSKGKEDNPISEGIINKYKTERANYIEMFLREGQRKISDK